MLYWSRLEDCDCKITRAELFYNSCIEHFTAAVFIWNILQLQFLYEIFSFAKTFLALQLLHFLQQGYTPSCL